MAAPNPWLERFHILHDWCLPGGQGPIPTSGADAQAKVAQQESANLLQRLVGRPTIGVSACLLGIPSRYDGDSKPVDGLVERLVAGGFDVIPVCPEVLAELGVPRPPMHFEGGDGRALLAGHAELIDTEGRSCSNAMRVGAARALDYTRTCTALLLKERSPSCGIREVHVGEEMVPGMGVFAAMAAEVGLALFDEEDLESFFRFLSDSE